VTDARFSGVSTGACIGHGSGAGRRPIGKLRDGDTIRIVIDRNKLEGSLDLVGEGGRTFTGRGAKLLAGRASRSDLAPAERLPDDTRLWAALQQVGGGTWGGCVYDVESVLALLESRRKS
jgi:dihydroxyacid dehydratase/phosphogluconate dehydratase